MRQLHYTAIKVGTSLELHATGCRDLRKWAGERAELTSDSSRNAEAAAREDGFADSFLATEGTSLKVMPCCNEVRMRAAGRIHEVADAPAAEPVAEPVAEVAPEPVAEPAPEPVAEEPVAPALSKRAAKRAAKLAAKLAEQIAS